MKKVIFVLFAAGILASCGAPSTESVETSTAVDSCATVSDSTVCVDTCATVVDSVK